MLSALLISKIQLMETRKLKQKIDHYISNISFQQYIFRSVVQMSSYTMSRNFVLEKQSTQETKIVKGEVHIRDSVADIGQILQEVGQPELFKFKIYDFADNKYHDVKDFNVDEYEVEKGYFVPAHLLRTEIVLMKYVLDASQTTSIKSGTQSASDASSVKKQRSKERTIAEVIEIVKQWRDIHLNNGSGKKVNLQESAEMLGISKKSLDDYYYQLRLGEKYDFDFSSHLNDKVGVLRTYIKDIKTSKKDNKSKMDKHPKKLKIIQEFGDFDVQQRTKTKSRKSKSSRSHSSQENEMGELNQNTDKMEQQAQKSNEKEISFIENQFYNEFQFMGEEPPDPFLNFQCDFKKKSYDDLSDQLFF